MKILVVDDEQKILDFIHLGLKEEGYVVDTASNGEDAYILAKTQIYDIIILDLNLPKMDGITVCKQLRKDQIFTPIIMLTVRNQTLDKVEGLDSGANDYLTKPFAFEELLARIRALLRTVNNISSSSLVLEDLELDLLTHKVTRNGKEIELSAKEYALLEYLMRNSGNVVTRTMIAENVWDMNCASYTNIIDVYINYLRNKIDSGYDVKLIRTIRGRGFSMRGN